MISSNNTHPAPAVVVGICAHGLAIVRALAKCGVHVHVLETNFRLPGVHTRYATTHHAADINGPGLVTSLLKLKDQINSKNKPVLFLTNDRMVQQVADHWHQLQNDYALSWSDCRENVARLLAKSAIEQQCDRSGLAYPKSVTINNISDVAGHNQTWQFPLIAKPAKPLSRFKVQIINSLPALESFIGQYESELPIVVQQWIPGDDTRISFCAFYLDKGKVLARFDGHKQRSRPMGHTTLAEARKDDEVFQQALRFFENMEFSGPVSLELKRDDRGKLWVIEPTVGRTDFWVGVTISNGVNLPYIEYCQQCRLTINQYQSGDRWIWMNMDRDFVSFFYFLVIFISSLPRIKLPSFLYFDLYDIKPLLWSYVAEDGLMTRFWRKLLRIPYIFRRMRHNT